MKKRILGAIAVASILLTGALLGNKIFAIVITIAAILGLKELIDIKYEKKKIVFIRVISYVLLSLFLFNNIFYKVDLKLLIVLSILCLIIPIVFYDDGDKYNINDAFYFIGIIYFMAFSFMMIISMRIDSIYKCMYIFIISFITDTYSYIGSLLIGKHKLSEISPKKTSEGSIVGTLMGTFVGSMYYYTVISDMSLINIVIMSFMLTILGEMGDLVFSSIKRYFGKKDYSNLIPGHGGILDRFDSVIFVSLGLMLIMILF